MIIQIPGFKGGLANSVYESLSKQTYQSAKGLNVFTFPNILLPNHSIDNDATDKTLNNIKLNAFIKGSDGRNYFKGFDEAGGTVLTIWDAATGALGSVTALTAEATAAGAGGSHGMVEFLSYLWFYETSTIIQNFNFTAIDDAVVTSVSDQAPIFVHQGLGKMFYTVSAYQIGSSADITPTNAAVITFDNAMRVVQMAEYGRFVVVGLNNVNGASSSKLAIWDGSSTTVDDIIHLGDTGIQSVVNVNGSIYILTSTNPFGWGSKNLIRIYKLESSGVKLVKELDLQATTTGAVTILPKAVAVLNNKIYFGMIASSATTIMTIDNGVYAYDVDQKILTLDRITSDTTAIQITSIDFNGGAMVVTWYDGTNYKISHVVSSPSVLSSGSYISNIFPLNEGKRGKIKRIKVMHKAMPASCGFTFKIKHFGHYPVDGSVLAADSFTAITTPQGSGSSTGKTQSTDDATYTIIEDLDKFEEADMAQIQIDFDEVSGLNAAEIIFPILIETVPTSIDI